MKKMILSEIKNSLIELKPFHKKWAIPNIYTWEELESLINLRPFVNDKRFVWKSTEKYKWNAGGWLTDLNSWPPDKLQKIIDNNVCYLRDASRANYKINKVCTELEQIFHAPADAHIYFNKNTREMNYDGLGRHNDTQHNLITLAQGKIEIKVWDDYNENIYKLEEGDVVFIPKGIDHQIISNDSRISVSFCIAGGPDFMQERDWITL